MDATNAIDTAAEWLTLASWLDEAPELIDLESWVELEGMTGLLWHLPECAYVHDRSSEADVRIWGAGIFETADGLQLRTTVGVGRAMTDIRIPIC